MLPLFKEMSLLATSVQSINLLEFHQGNNEPTRFIRVAKISTFHSFRKNAHKCEFLDQLLKGSLRSKESANAKNRREDEMVEALTDEELLLDGSNREDNFVTEATEDKLDDTAEWHLELTGRKCIGAFFAVAVKLNLPLKGKRMSAEQVFSMWEEANANTAGRRIVMKHFGNHHGWRFAPPDREIVALVDEHVVPTTGEATVDELMIPFWHKDINDVACLANKRHTAKLVVDGEDKATGVNLVIGADHGQGKSRAGMMTTLWCGSEVID